MTMYELKNELEPMGVVVRYKDYVVAAEFVNGPKGKGYSLTVWEPQDISKEKEMGSPLCRWITCLNGRVRSLN